MNAWKRVLFEEYLNYKYKKNTSAIDLDVIKIKTIVIKNDMTKYKLKRNVK